MVFLFFLFSFSLCSMFFSATFLCTERRGAKKVAKLSLKLLYKRRLMLLSSLACIAVIITKIAIVDCGVVCIYHSLQEWLLLIGRFLQALIPHVPCRFVREGVDGVRYLAVAPRLLVACFFGLIITTVIFPVASAGALDARTFLRSTFIAVIAIANMLDVTASIIAIAVRVVSWIA